MIRVTRNQAGFTLLEILVALAVFAVMSIMAHQGLRAILDADHITRGQSQRLADLQVTLSVLERDLAQVISSSTRDEYGDRLPPLRLRPGSDAVRLELVRSGAGGSERLRRTAWVLHERGLERELWPGVDVVDPESKRLQRFADLVDEDEQLGINSSFYFLVRTDSGIERVDSWPPADGSDSARLPLAIELVLDLPQLGEVRRLMAVGL
ncbi:type II secretion system minor pseudopilin GspJ [Halopseudomonas salegens]|uniref:Type II secretion system protein J n=1 Tax=Halopseudomonas salegens TaxID=1434072 RepID=A0A1H2GBN0_9GAMM|nr:type II secretion system minor pseudopilin GspJ [Halopseudomonas salegens]SDU16934.1 general secretion pathway protein J [Halopseudomonas salegens]